MQTELGVKEKPQVSVYRCPLLFMAGLLESHNLLRRLANKPQRPASLLPSTGIISGYNHAQFLFINVCSKDETHVLVLTKQALTDELFPKPRR